MHQLGLSAKHALERWFHNSGPQHCEEAFVLKAAFLEVMASLAVLEGWIPVRASEEAARAAEIQRRHFFAKRLSGLKRGFKDFFKEQCDPGGGKGAKVVHTFCKRAAGKQVEVVRLKDHLFEDDQKMVQDNVAGWHGFWLRPGSQQQRARAEQNFADKLELFRESRPGAKVMKSSRSPLKPSRKPPANIQTKKP